MPLTAPHDGVKLSPPLLAYAHLLARIQFERLLWVLHHPLGAPTGTQNGHAGRPAEERGRTAMSVFRGRLHMKITIVIVVSTYLGHSLVAVLRHSPTAELQAEGRSRVLEVCGPQILQYKPPYMLIFVFRQQAPDQRRWNARHDANVRLPFAVGSHLQRI